MNRIIWKRNFQKVTVMKDLITGLGRIAYAVTGHGSELVFLHSALADHRQWCEQVEALSSNYRCISYDLLGYGSSENAPETYDPSDTLLELLDHLEVETATLVGSSLGGSVAIHAACRFPDRVRSIFVAGTGLFGFQPQLDGPEPEIYREYEEALAHHDTTRIVDLAERIWLIGTEGSESRVPRVSRDLFRMMYRDFLNNRRKFPEYQDLDDKGALANLDRPVMVLIGENDTLYCLKVANYLENILPRATLIRMPGVAHFPNLSQPRRLTELLLQWLNEGPRDNGN